MQTREKILLIVLIGSLVIWWGRPILFASFLQPLEDRRNRIQALQSDLDNKQIQELRILKAVGSLTQFRAAALPADPLDAQRAYTIWLTDLLEQCGWTETEVLPGKIARLKNLGSALEIRIDGTATSAQLAEFCNRLDHANLLQRVERLTVQAQSIEPDSPLTVSLNMEAISLTESTQTDLAEVVVALELDETWQQFGQLSPFTKKRPVKISTPRWNVASTLTVNRGDKLEQTIELTGLTAQQLPAQLEWTRTQTDSDTQAEGLTFDPQSRLLSWDTNVQTAPADYPISLTATLADGKQLTHELTVRVVVPNTPPELADVPEQIVYPLEQWSYQLAANDADDPAQTLSFTLTGDRPDSLSVDPQTGQLTWTAPSDMAGKTVAVTAIVTDDGSPPKSDSVALNLKIERDYEMSTKLIGCIEIDGTWTAWFADSAQNKRFALKPGGQLNVGRYTATIESINVDQITLQADDKTATLELGQPVKQRRVVESVDP